MTMMSGAPQLAIRAYHRGKAELTITLNLSSGRTAGEYRHSCQAANRGTIMKNKYGVQYLNVPNTGHTNTREPNAEMITKQEYKVNRLGIV
jgi:hypothetical protein